MKAETQHSQQVADRLTPIEQELACYREEELQAHEGRGRRKRPREATSEAARKRRAHDDEDEDDDGSSEYDSDLELEGLADEVHLHAGTNCVVQGLQLTGTRKVH